MSAARKKRRTYHHDDLRQALLDAAAAYLRVGDVTGLTMQALARATGVSVAAPYHHFSDKVTLLAALATEGYARWNALAARAVADAPEAPLAALARAWLAFTAAHPGHFRVMFLPDIADRSRFVEMHATSDQSLALLLSLVGDTTRAVVAWSTMHGFASLRNAGVLANIPGLPTVEALERAAVEQVVSASESGTRPAAARGQRAPARPRTR